MNVISWIFPILSGLLDALARATLKTTKVHTFALVASAYLVGLPFYLAWLLIEGVPELKPGFWVTISWHAPLLTIAITMMVHAHRVSPLTLTVPYLSFTPAFLLLTAPLLGGGTPTVAGALGVIVLTAGLYILNAKNAGSGILAPFRAIAREKGSWMMLIVAFIFSFTSVGDYRGMSQANAPLFLIIDSGVISLIMVTILVAKMIRAKKGEEREKLLEIISPLRHAKPITFYGLVLAGSIIAHMLSFKFIHVVPYVIASKRAAMICSTIGIALFLAYARKHEAFQGEKHQVAYRLAGVFLMVTGMVTVILYGTR